MNYMRPGLTGMRATGPGAHIQPMPYMSFPGVANVRGDASYGRVSPFAPHRWVPQPLDTRTPEETLLALMGRGGGSGMVRPLPPWIRGPHPWMSGGRVQGGPMGQRRGW